LELNNPHLDAPKADEVEISLFGPSYGECVVVHAGDGIWFVIDSCIIPGTGKSRPIEYFKSIGIDPSHAVKKIVATHWDGDHIGGLSQLLEVAKQSDFVVSGAVFCREFLTLIRLYDNSQFVSGPSVKEYAKILEILSKRGKQPLLAQQQMTIWNRNVGDQEVACLISLAPSSAEVINGHKNIAKMLKHGQLAETNRNERSVVLWLKVENAIVLLGGDLEEVNDKDRGWSAIILSDVKRPKAQLFKVPHHGSSTSHNQQIWSDLLVAHPPAIIAPWRKGNNALPTSADIERIQQMTDHLYVTTIPQNKQNSRPNEIQRMIHATVKNIRKVDESLGHIRLRTKFQKINPVWEVALFNGARKVEGKMAKAFPKPL
jgi:hypothetical protein